MYLRMWLFFVNCYFERFTKMMVTGGRVNSKHIRGRVQERLESNGFTIHSGIMKGGEGLRGFDIDWETAGRCEICELDKV